MKPSPSPAAERQRRHRERKKRGDALVSVTLPGWAIVKLREWGYLKGPDAPRPEEIQTAFGEFLTNIMWEEG